MGTPVDNLAIAALGICAITSTFTTTVAYSFQLTGSMLQDFAWPKQIPQWVNDMLNMGMLTRGSNIEPPIMMWAAHKLMADCTFTLPLDYLTTQNWAPQPIAIPGAIQLWHFGLAHDHHGFTYTWGNPLAILHVIVTRPVEWGISYHHPTVDFSKEVQTTGPLLIQSWYSSLGDRGYIETASGATPYTYVPYSAFAINIICQCAGWLAPPS